MPSKKTYAEIVAEEEQFKDTDREVEGLVRVTARVGKEARAVFAVRLSAAELKAITEAAAEQGRTAGDFIRTAALAAVEGTLNVDAAQRVATAAEVKDKLRELEAVASRL